MELWAVDRAICALEKMDREWTSWDARALCLPPAQQPWSATSDLYPLQPDRACRLWREYRAGAAFRPACGSAVNSMVAKRMSKASKCAGPPRALISCRSQSGDGERQSTQRLRHKPDLPTLPLHPIFQPTLPCSEPHKTPDFLAALSCLRRFCISFCGYLTSSGVTFHLWSKATTYYSLQ